MVNYLMNDVLIIFHNYAHSIEKLINGKNMKAKKNELIASRIARSKDGRIE